MTDRQHKKQFEIIERMQHAINGPHDPSMPQASPFLVEDAEAEIRRSTQRHFAQLAQIAELTTDRDHWRQEALLHKAEVDRLSEKLKDAEQHSNDLREVIITLRAQFDLHTEGMLKSYRTLQTVGRLKVVTPPALEAFDKALPERFDEEHKVG